MIRTANVVPTNKVHRFLVVTPRKGAMTKCQFAALVEFARRKKLTRFLGVEGAAALFSR